MSIHGVCSTALQQSSRSNLHHPSISMRPSRLQHRGVHQRSRPAAPPLVKSSEAQQRPDLSPYNVQHHCYQCEPRIPLAGHESTEDRRRRARDGANSPRRDDAVSLTADAAGTGKQKSHTSVSTDSRRRSLFARTPSASRQLLAHTRARPIRDRLWTGPARLVPSPGARRRRHRRGSGRGSPG